jgi:DNA integrity scanning protein DisA with diadenylate cyclase activity
MLTVKERFMEYSPTKILASEIGYPRYSRKITTEILKKDYALSNMIVRFPEKVYDDMFFTYEDIRPILEAVR